MAGLAETFTKLRSNGEKALVLFVTAGDPSLAELPAILECLSEAGADVIEVGIPFSDPIADGPVIQASSQRALDRGVTPSAILESLSKSKVASPIVAMGYVNNALRRGLSRYAGELVESGVSGTIMCDLTVDESDDWIAASRAADLDTIFLVAPTSTEERIRLAAEASRGFVYAVSRTGVTGADSPHVRTALSAGDLVGHLRAATSTPVCVGFGLSRPDQVRNVCQFADGAIIGSWLVQEIAEKWDSGRGARALAAEIRDLKAATRS